MTTAGSASGGGPFHASVSIGAFGNGSFVTTGSSSTEAVGTFQIAVGSGDINYEIATNSQGFAWDDTTPSPFFVSAIYCKDTLEPSVSIAVPFAFTPGHSYNCYAELAKAATVNLTKVVVGGSSSWEYDFGLANTTDLSKDLNTHNDVDDVEYHPTNSSPVVSWTEVLKPGAQYTVTEYDVISGDYPSDIDVNCLGDSDTGTFTPAAGETINCTAINIVNIPVTIHKFSTGSDGTFDFTLSHDSGPTNVSVSTTGADTDGFGEGSATVGLMAEGAYTITETDLAGWTEGGINCVVQNWYGKYSTSTGGFSAVLGDWVDCYVLNQRPLDVTMTKTVTGDTAPQPGGTTQYTMVVTNHSSQYWAPFLAVVDKLPAHLVPTDTPTSFCAIKGGQTLNCQLPPLAPGASATIVVNVQVAADAPVPVSLDNTADLYSYAAEDAEPTTLVSVAAQIPGTGSDTINLMLLALATLGVGVGLLGFSRRSAVSR